MTAQMHEKLILEGEHTTMAFCPPIPKDHPQIQVLDNDELDEAVQAGDASTMVRSTACWRQYVGTWELKDGKFYLVEVRGRLMYTDDEPIFADWVTAVLRIPSGKQLHYVHMGFGSVYEFENHIKIENGIVVQERRIDNRDKDIDPNLGWKNLPGSENNFDGDDL
jgi:hypothetical protein